MSVMKQIVQVTRWLYDGMEFDSQEAAERAAVELPAPTTSGA